VKGITVQRKNRGLSCAPAAAAPCSGQCDVDPNWNDVDACDDQCEASGGGGGRGQGRNPASKGAYGLHQPVLNMIEVGCHLRPLGSRLRMCPHGLGREVVYEDVELVQLHTEKMPLATNK
jgi:hypothetical protein